MNGIQLGSRVRQVDGEHTISMVENTVFDDTAVSRQPTLVDSSKSFTALYQTGAAGTSLRSCVQAARSGAIYTETPFGSGTKGLPAEIFYGYADSQLFPSSVDGITGLDWTLVGAQLQEFGVVLHPYGAETAAGSAPAGQEIDNGDDSDGGFLYSVHVTARAPAGIVVRLRLMHSTDNVTYTQAAAADFSSAGAALVQGTGTLNRYVRWNVVTISGSLSSITFISAVARRA
jgi:hypothetical protein